MKYDVLLKLINENKSINEITNILGISSNELYKYLLSLRKKGHRIVGNYYNNGDIYYELKKRIADNEFFLNTDVSEKEIDLMVISDLHLGSFYETPKLLDRIYNFCINENIHVILNIGDFVEGCVNNTNVKIPPLKQINHALRVHPFDSSIYNLLLLGNHDYSLLTNYGIDIETSIKESRYDIIPLGYGEEIINIKNDFIVLLHPLKSSEMKTRNYKNTLIIRGHGHESKVCQDKNNLIMYTPSLSKLNFNKSTNPGAIKLKLLFKNGFIKNVLITDLIFFNSKLLIAKESNFYINENDKKLEKVIK